MRNFRKYKKPRSVLIVKPHRVDNQVDERVDKFIMKAFQRGIAEYMPIGSKTPDLPRNIAIDEFLHSSRFRDKAHIFFLDADTEPVNDYCIERLLGYNKDVIAGITPIWRTKTDTVSCMWSAIVKNKQSGGFENVGIDELPKKLFKADRTGGTTLLVSRKALSELKPPYQQTHYNKDWTNVDLSEDFDFCDKLHAAGFDIWIDPNEVCHHYHLLDILDVFEAYRKALKLGA